LRREEDTIYALSTASGRAAIAIIRVSGPACLDVCLFAVSYIPRQMALTSAAGIPCIMSGSATPFTPTGFCPHLV
jgi:hypothetical protein